MNNLPCEYVLWYGIPVIRKEIANCLIKNYGLNQKETANKLGVTPAAICQYMSKKRGRISIMDKKIINEINISAKLIIENGESEVNSQICRICKILKSEGLLKFKIDK